jgi:hypothetical protein
METTNSLVKGELPQRLTKIGIPLLIFVAIVFNVLTPVFASSWAQQPFLGAFFYPTMRVADAYNPNWLAHQLGLQPAATLLRLDGQPVHSGRDVYNYLRQKQINAVLLLYLKSDLELSEQPAEILAILLTPFSWQDLFIFFWLPYGIGVLYLMLGLFVYRWHGADHRLCLIDFPPDDDLFSDRQFFGCFAQRYGTF